MKTKDAIDSKVKDVEAKKADGEFKTLDASNWNKSDDNWG